MSLDKREIRIVFEERERIKMKAAFFAADLRRNRQITLPIENIKALAAHLGVVTQDFDGCSLQLQIHAIRINNVWKSLSSIEDKTK